MAALSAPPAPAAQAALPPLPAVTASADAPIGVFDSGLGGLSVLRAIQQQLPGERLIYLADTRWAPYGALDDAHILERSRILTEHLVVTHGAKAIVIACNTATAHAIGALRQQYPTLPIIGTEPGLKPALALPGDAPVGALMTAATLRSARFQRLRDTLAGNRTVLCAAGIGLVELIERNQTGTPEMHALLRSYVDPMVAAGATTLVLGCTHYALLIPDLELLYGPQLRLVETGPAIARQVGRLLQERGTLAPSQHVAPVQLQASGQDELLHALASAWLPAVERLPGHCP